MGTQPLRAGTVIIADESSTASSADSVALAELALECGGKLVEIGDPRQIGAIGPGGLYGHLTQIVEPSVLTEIRRQRAEVDREIVRLAHAGRGSDALDLLRFSSAMLTGCQDLFCSAERWRELRASLNAPPLASLAEAVARFEAT